MPPLYFYAVFAKIGQKTRKKALKKIPVYVTIIICGEISPFPQTSIIFDIQQDTEQGVDTMDTINQIWDQVLAYVQPKLPLTST